MTNEQIQQSAQLIDNLISQAPATRAAHLNGAACLKNLIEKAENVNSLKEELEAAKKQIAFNEATIESLNSQLTEKSK